MNRSRLLLVVILLTGFALRLIGLQWGLPDQYHSSSFHLDEEPILVASFRVFPLMPRLNPHFFPHGTAQTYLISGALKTAALIGYVDLPTPELAAKDPKAYYRLFSAPRVYVTGRFLSALMSTLALGVIYALGCSLFSPGAGLLAALFVAILPLDIVPAHFLKSDSAMVLWLCLSLLFASRLFKGGNVNKNLIFAGLCAGFATVTKYTGAVVFFPLAAAILLSGQPFFLSLMKLAGGITAGMLCGMPMLLFEPLHILHSIYNEFHEQVHASFNQGVGPGPRFLYYFSNGFYYGCRIPMLLLFSAGLCRAVQRRSRSDLFLFALLVPYLLLLAAGSMVLARYTLPLLPLLALLAGCLVMELIGTGKKALTVAAVLLVCWVVVYTSGAGLAYSLLMTEKDVRLEALEKIQQQAAPPATVGMVSREYYSVPLPPTPLVQVVGYGFVRASTMDYLVMSSDDYEPPLRLRQKYPREYNFLHRVFEGNEFVLLDKFEKRPHLFNWVFKEEYLLSDWELTHPAILFFQNVKKVESVTEKRK